MPRSGEVVIPFVTTKDAATKLKISSKRAPVVPLQSGGLKTETPSTLRIPFHTEGQVIPPTSRDIKNKGKMTATFMSTISEVGKQIRSDDPPEPDEQDDG